MADNNDALQDAALKAVEATGPQGKAVSFAAKNWKAILLFVLTWVLLVILFSSFAIYLICNCLGYAMGSMAMRGFDLFSLSGGNTSTTGQGSVLQKSCLDKINANASKYMDIVNSAASKYGMDPALIAAVIEQESGWTPTAKNPTSGAMGMMQFLPSTWQEEKTDGNGDGIIDPFNAADNIYAGTKYLKKRILWANNDVWKGVAGYGEGTQYAREVKARYEQYKKCLTAPNANIVNSPTDNCETIRSRIIQVARSKIGAPYVHGGIGPNSFDCAGFVGWVWWEASGESWNDMHHSMIPSFSSQMDYIKVNSEADLKIGDMLFRGAPNGGGYVPNTANPGDYEHSAIYIGNGLVAQEGGGSWDTSVEGPASGAVRITKLKDGAWLNAKEVGRPKRCTSATK